MGFFTGDLFSHALKLNTQVNVIFPDESSESAHLITGEPSVLYLLHGLSDNASAWTRFTKLEYYAKKYNFIVVMPEAGRSFYTDMRLGQPYFTYIADELPELLGRWLRLPDTREKTFIAGQSMGGYGAVKAGLSRPERFGGIGCLSGALDVGGLLEADKGVSLEEALFFPGEKYAVFGADLNILSSEKPIELIRGASALERKPKLIQVCGTEDFLLKANRDFKAACDRIGYPVKYMEWQGAHTWLFWDGAIQRVMQFFCGLDPDTQPLD
ncbi:alpha/beta hydrolase family protein [Anaerolentibacter hominis]|uniref:alpha/beta hydrolase n=1 Tax=Anaerolentibacter hominis TaxID=3079009 RepID=UPI0031B83753